MESIFNHIDLSKSDYNFRHFAKIRGEIRNSLQQHDDERFLPARVDYDLLGDVLAAKHQNIMKCKNIPVKEFNKKKDTKQKEKESILNKIISYFKK